MIPYGKQSIEEDDIETVVNVLRSDFLTQGPMVEAFERAFSERVGARFAVAVNSGTAALHACMIALGVGPGDEIIVPPITFTASANCALFVGATPVFADVTASGHIDPKEIEKKISKKTKAVIAVDYAGMPCDYSAILKICEKHSIPLVCDVCHALGATWNNRPLGAVGLLNNFSFHPVKHIATGEGGMVTTDDAGLAQNIRDFRTHGITKDASRFKGLGSGSSSIPRPSSLLEHGPWYYEMQLLGFNYRISDINCALGLSQLKKLDRFVARRRKIASMYYDGLKNIPHLQLPFSDLHPSSFILHPLFSHSFHLFPVNIDFAGLGKSRSRVMNELRENGVGTQVHYIPVCLQPYYREKLGIEPGMYPAAEKFYAGELSIPMYPAMTDEEICTVIRAIGDTLI